MPHTRGPAPSEEVPGAQWRWDAEEATSATSSHYRAGRGFGTGDCATGTCDHPHHHDAQPDDTEQIIGRVLARIKRASGHVPPSLR